MRSFLTAVVQTIILLIQGIIIGYVEAIHLFAAGLEIISITPGLGALDGYRLPVYIGWNCIHPM